MLSGFLKKRQHPVKILGYTTRTFWLLFIPLARSLVAVKFDIATWLEGWWLDMIVIGIMFLYAFLRWFFVTFEIKNEEICAKTGLFGIKNVSIPYVKVCTVCCSQNFFYKLINAYNVYIDTNSGSLRKSDLTLLVKKEDIEKLKEFSKEQPSQKPVFSYCPRKRNLLVFSLLFSSTLSGVILFATLIIQSSRIVGREIEQRFFKTLSDYAKQFTVNLPAYVVTIALVVVLGWLYSFVVNIVRHWNFNVTRTSGKLLITSGVFARRFHMISVDKINYIDLRQSLLMKIFKICSVHIHCTGYGKSKREIAVLIPVTTLAVVEKTVGLLLGEFVPAKITLKPRVKNIMRFLWPPLLLCATIPLTAGVVSYFVNGWSEIIRFVSIMLEIPSMWLVAVKAASIFTTGIGYENGLLNLSYCKLYKFHTIIVNKNKVSKISLYQNPAQYLFKNCSFKINTHGESNTSHKIKNFPLTKAQRFFCKTFNIK